MVANILPADPLTPKPRPQGWGQKVKIQLFLEHAHVAYQIKGNQEMQQHGGQNSTFSEHVNVIYQIKGSHECSNMVANILSTNIPPTLGMGPIGQTSAFSEHGHVAYQSKGINELKQHGSKYYALRPPRPWLCGQ